MELELDLSGPDAGQRRRVVERRLHPVAVADRADLYGRRLRWALVDDHLTRGAGERRERRDAPVVNGDALGTLGEQQVDHVLDVLEVDQVAGLAAGVRTR